MFLPQLYVLCIAYNLTLLPRLVAQIVLFGQIWFRPKGEQRRFNPEQLPEQLPKLRRGSP